jgi:peptidase M28-like protein
MRIQHRGGTALMLIVAAGLAASAQRGRGEPQPPVRPHSNEVDTTHARQPLAAADQKYAGLDGARMKQFVNDITAISRKSRDEGVKYWGRIAGTKADKEMEEYAARRFREIGLQDVRMQPFTLPPQWFALDWDVTASGGGQSLALKTAFPSGRSAATPPGGVDLDIVWVGAGTELDYAGRDVKGKAVFITSFPTPSANIHTASQNGAMERAVQKGAAATILNIYLPGNVVNEAGGAQGLPSFAIGNEDAAALRKMMEKGPTKLHVKLSTEMRSNLTDSNVWGTLPGATDEEVVIFAHHDGYFEAAFDNATGSATMLGLAEYFAKIPQAQRKRTLKFVSTAAHHAGSPGTRWMYDNLSGAMAKTVLVINCEHTSITQQYLQGPDLRRSNAINAERWWVNGSDKLAGLVLDAYRTFGVSVLEGMEPGASGDMGPIGRVVPSIQLITSPYYYHSDHDRASDVPEAGLERVARAYARIIDQSSAMDRAALKGEVPSTRSGR